MDVFVQSKKEEQDANEYVRERMVTELFQSITVGLLHHRPDDPHQFIFACLEHIRQLGWQNVFWDTFLPRERHTVELGIVMRTRDGGQERDTAESEGVKEAEETAKAAAQRTTSGHEPSLSQHPVDSVSPVQALAGYDATIWRVLQGSLQDLPPMPSNTVRIFLSSTFSDFKAERNILPRRAYPELSAFCRERGLDFQVVDMRWGVTDDVVNDHQVSELCIKEIALCQQISCGPNFVTLLGDRYGFRPFPVKIEASEFEQLASISARGLDESDSALLNEWFWKDENAVPAAYILQPIPARLKYYNDTSPEHDEKRFQARQQWNIIFSDLQRILQSCSQTAVEEGSMHQADAEKFHISVTENEVHRGLLKPADVSDKALCYIRRLTGISQTDLNQPLSRFVDNDGNGHPDENAMHLVTSLQEEKIPSKLQGSQLRKYKPQWKGVPLEESGEQEHIAYLEKFSNDFVTDMKTLITKNLLIDTELKTRDTKALYQEVLHHAKFAQTKCEIFCGREKALVKVRDYVASTQDLRRPLIVCGQSGFGKTSLLSYIAKSMPDTAKGNVSVVLRLLGTTPRSSNILSTLQSVIQQISLQFDLPLSTEGSMNNMSDARQYFWSVLESVGKDHPDRKLAVILDSVDQLAETYGGHKMIWLPRRLPGNVSMVVSMLSDRYTCLANAKLRIPEPESYCELEPLSPATGENIISEYMALHSRCLTEEQKQMVTEVFAGCRQPLFLKLVLDSARTWNSYTPTESITMATSVHEAITQLFETLEATYGKTFVQKSLGYLTCGLGGLTSLELEDALSCDDEVLVDVYQYHDPPLEGTVRIPTLLWSRVEHFLREYLVEKQVHGKTVLTWYHRQFWETAEERYVSSEENKLGLHSTLADLFDQETGIKRTIVLARRKGKVVENADRRVTPQSLTASNARKLGCLPFHLLHAGRTEELKSKCLINFQWMLTKLEAVGARDLLQEYNEAIADARLTNCKAIELVRNLMELCYDALHYDPHLLPYHVHVRMAAVDLKQDPLLEMFVGHAEMWIQGCQAPLLLPTHAMNFLGLDSALKFSIVVGYDGVLSADEKMMVCNVTRGNSSQNKLQVLLLGTKDIVSSVTVSKKTLVTMDKTNQFFLYFDMQRLKMCEVESGELVKEVMYGTKECESDVPRFIEMSQNGKYLALGVRYGKPRDLGGKAWKTECLLSLIDMGNFESSIINVPFTGRKQVDSAAFVDGDTKLVCLSRDNILVHQIPSLDIVHQLDSVQGIYGRISQHLPQRQRIIAGVKDNDGARILVYSYRDNSFEVSDCLNVDEATAGEVAEPFAVQAKDDLSMVLIGVNTMELAGHACLWMWQLADGTSTVSQYTQIPVGVGIAKMPTTMKVTPDWTHALVGWDNGELTIACLHSHTEVLGMNAHGHAIHFLQVTDRGQALITMSSDHTLKMWDMEILHQEATSRHESTEATKQDAPFLDHKEQCVDLTCWDDDLLTVDHLGCLKLWNQTDGKLLQGCTDRLRVAYEEFSSREASRDQTRDMRGRQSATVDVYDDTVLCTWKKGHETFLYVVKGINDPVILQHECVPEAFFCLAPNHGSLIPNARGQLEVILVRNGRIEVRDLVSLQVTQTIHIPEISVDVGSINSHGGKRKLKHMKTAMTFDGKYFLLVNPSPPKQKDKYFHLVDLQKAVYLDEVDMESVRLMPWKIIGFYSFYFLVWKKGQLPEIRGPSMMAESGEHFDYESLLYSEKSFLSEDLSLGFEFTQDYTINLWKIAPLAKLHTLEGHVTEVTTGSFSKDNRHFVSGSFDNTVRLWSTSTGQQLCMFHMYGAVDNVFFNPRGSNVLVHCFATPERKRAVVLEIKKCTNVKRN